MSKYKKGLLRVGIVMACGIAFTSMLYMGKNISRKKDAIIAEAVNDKKEYKWTKKIIEKGTTVNAAYLWPDEVNPVFTSVYRGGSLLPDEKMVTISDGSVYHFRGLSESSILYTQVYVGAPAKLDITAGESGTWYNLLPSVIRKAFESDGWTWQLGWEYTGRAYLDVDNKRVMIKENDQTAVLYGVGLYLDNKHSYSTGSAFVEEGITFTEKFGDTDNFFASALEVYYTKGGELQTVCPEIYALIAGTMSKFGESMAESKTDTQPDGQQSAKKPEKKEKSAQTVTSDNPALVKELLEYINKKRSRAGLKMVSWNDSNDNNIITRVKEVSEFSSQTRPDGSDAFSAYTDDVKCEIRVVHTGSVEEIFDSAKNYFYRKNLKAVNCAVYNDVGILIFIW